MGALHRCGESNPLSLLPDLRHDGVVQGGPLADAIAIPVGLFCDPQFPAPKYSVWEARKHPWVGIDAEVEHHD